MQLWSEVLLHCHMHILRITICTEPMNVSVNTISSSTVIHLFFITFASTQATLPSKMNICSLGSHHIALSMRSRTTSTPLHVISGNNFPSNMVTRTSYITSLPHHWFIYKYSTSFSPNEQQAHSSAPPMSTINWLTTYCLPYARLSNSPYYGHTVKWQLLPKCWLVYTQHSSQPKARATHPTIYILMLKYMNTKTYNPIQNYT